jgi:hypothetical protein
MQLSEAEEGKQNLADEIQKLSVLNKNLLAERDAITERYKPIIDQDAEKHRILGELESNKSRLLGEIHQTEFNHKQALEALTERSGRASEELATLQKNTEIIRRDIAKYEETAEMQSFGFYTPRYGFDSSGHYQNELDRIRGKQKQMIAQKTTAVCDAAWTVNGGAAEGRKQTNQTIKLILRAFNGKCDAAIAKVKYSNVKVMEARILKAHEALNKLVSVQRAEITRPFLNLKLEELYLVHEHQEKLQEEKEEQRRIREEMREEEIARREIEKALEEAGREESRYAEALRKATADAEKAVGEKQAKLLAQIQLLQEKLTEAQANRERAVSRAQMTRSGHVYVISNIGSFGENIYKIGMTRRLDPLDRVRELGDASVPFKFDVHAVIYSEDAPALENKLHHKFHDRRVNRVNHLREFFQVSLDEIAGAVHEFHGEIELTLSAEAEEYRKTVAFLEAGHMKNLPAQETELLEI